MPEDQIYVDIVCIYCGHPWTVEVGINEKKEIDDDLLKCPKCGKDGGKRVE